MKSAFSVYKFNLCQTADGKLSQEISRCGEFNCIEQAFDTARLAALQEWQAALEEDRRESREVANVREILIKDTEWGYELKRDHMTVVRLWVHDGKPAEIAGM